MSDQPLSAISLPGRSPAPARNLFAAGDFFTLKPCWLSRRQATWPQSHLAADEQLPCPWAPHQAAAQLVEGMHAPGQRPSLSSSGCCAHIHHLMGMAGLHLGRWRRMVSPFRWLFATNPAMLITSLAEPKGGAPWLQIP